VFFVPGKLINVRAMDNAADDHTQVSDEAGSIMVVEEIPEVIRVFEAAGVHFIRLLRKGIPLFFASRNIVRVREPSLVTAEDQCEVVNVKGGITVQNPLGEVLELLDASLSD